MLLELKNHFSSNELVKLLSLSYHSLACKEHDEFENLIIDLKELFFYENVLYAQADRRSIIRSDRKNLDINLYNINYPNEYLDIYLHNMNFLKDDVFKKFILSLTPTSWHPGNSLSLPNEVLSAAVEFNIRTSWLHGALTTGGNRVTVFGFASPVVEYDQRVLKIIKYIIPFYAEAFQRLLQQTPAPIVKLTKKETEVLNWIKEGKSSWEISVMLKCSKRTVDFHVDNIKKKLNVVTRAQAVATGLHYGVITF